VLIKFNLTQSVVFCESVINTDQNLVPIEEIQPELPTDYQYH